MKISELYEYIDTSEVIKKQHIAKFAAAVKKDCVPFLSHKRPSDVLYRGRQKAKSKIELNVPLKKRTDSWTTFEATKELSKIMNQHGFEATRQDGYLVYSSSNAAGRPSTLFFGEPFAIFPVGRYSLTWTTTNKGLSPDVGDNMWIKKGKEAAKEKGISISENDFESIAKAYWDKYGQCYMQGTDVSKAVDSGTEIIIKANSFHAIWEPVFREFYDMLINTWYG